MPPVCHRMVDQTLGLGKPLGASDTRSEIANCGHDPVRCYAFRRSRLAVAEDIRSDATHAVAVNARHGWEMSIMSICQASQRAGARVSRIPDTLSVVRPKQ